MSIFVKFDGPIEVKGEVLDEGHKDGWIDCNAFTYSNERNSGEGLTGQSRKRADVKMNDISISKEMDMSSVPLIHAIIKGVVFKKVQISFTASYTDGGDGNARMPFYEIELEHVMVTNFEQSGDPDDIPNETFSLNFEKIKYKYKRRTDEGKQTGEESFDWDVQKGARLG